MYGIIDGKLTLELSSSNNLSNAEFNVSSELLILNLSYSGTFLDKIFGEISLANSPSWLNEALNTVILGSNLSMDY